MREGQMLLQLRPLQGGAYTELLLSGVVPTTLPAPVVRRLLATLSLWSGWPVALALCVEAEAASWCALWSDALSRVPERHLEIRFVLPQRHAGR